MSETNRITVHPVPDAEGFIAARPKLYTARVYVNGTLAEEVTVLRRAVPILCACYGVRRAIWCRS